VYIQALDMAWKLYR